MVSVMAMGILHLYLQQLGVQVADDKERKERNPQRFSPGNSLPTTSASFRRLSPFSRDAWSLQLAA
jgi:hypothetical protein